MEDMGWTLCGNPLSVDTFETTAISVTPNPFSESITITLDNVSNDKITVHVLDINGRVVLDTTETSINGTITVSNLNQLEDAFYFVKITNQSNGSSITKKIIKN